MAKRKPNYFRIDGIESRVFSGDLPKQSYGRFRHSSRVAIGIADDKETKIALIQICTPDLGVVIVRINEGQTPLYMLEILKNPHIQKVFHDALSDCSLIMKQFGIRVENTASTKIAAELMFNNPKISTSLTELLHKFLDVKVSKKEQQSNWLSPSLTVSQINYATRSVLYLCPLLDKFSFLKEKESNLKLA